MAGLSEWLRVRLAGGQRAAPVPGRSVVFTDSASVGPAFGGMSVDQAMRLADVYACVRVLADNVGSIPLVCYQRSDAGRVRDRVSIAARVLDRPSPAVTQAGLMASMTAHLVTAGEVMVAKVRNPLGDIGQLHVVDPRRVSVAVRGGEPEFRIDGKDTVFTRRDVLHVKGMSFDGVRGVSPITQTRAALQAGLTMEEQAEAFTRNAATPVGALKVAGELSDEAADRLSAQWQATYGGRNRGRVAILEDGTEFQSISISPVDAQFVEQRKLSSTQIARIFRVPPYMIGAESGSSMTYSNVEQETLQLVTHTLRPWLVAIEQAFANDEDLFPVGSGRYPEFLIDAILRADTKTRYEAYSLALGGAAFMSVNEPRARENLPVVAGGDQVGLSAGGAVDKAKGA